MRQYRFSGHAIELEPAGYRSRATAMPAYARNFATFSSSKIYFYCFTRARRGHRRLNCLPMRLMLPPTYRFFAVSGEFATRCLRHDPVTGLGAARPSSIMAPE